MSNRYQRNAQLRYEKERRKNLLAQPGAHQFVLVLDHLKAGFNVPKIFRSAEAFGAAAVHLVAVGPFDPAPAKGSFRKVPAVFHESFAACRQQLLAAGFTLFCLDPERGKSLCEVRLPEKSAFVLGHEEFGRSFENEDYPEIQPLSIPQFGSVQSLNVSTAAALVMYEYIRQRHSVPTA